MTHQTGWTRARVLKFETRTSMTGIAIMRIALDVNGVGPLAYCVTRVGQARTLLGDSAFQIGAAVSDWVDQAELTARLAIDQRLEVLVKRRAYRGVDLPSIEGARPPTSERTG